VGILIEPARGYERALLSGIAQYVNVVSGWQLHVPQPFWERASDFSPVDFLGQYSLDGVITIETSKINSILALGIPTVVSNAARPYIPGAINIVTDHQTAGFLAADHLMQCGFSHFAFCGYGNMFWSFEREEGFLKRLRDAHGDRLSYHAQHFRALANEEAYLLSWLNKLPKPVGIFAGTDERGRQLIQLCTKAGLHVPDVVGVVGMDNDELLCMLAPTPLSSLAQDAERGGYLAAKRLDDWMRHPTRRPRGKPVLIHPLHVVARQSTHIIFCSDSHVTRAVRFIQDNATSGISVTEVASHVGLSRRVLEKRFRKTIGLSILHEIRRCRCERMARMLTETRLPVSEIALQSGFPDGAHFARYFRAHKRLTPRMFRDKFSRL
jgi:LacI family transcriptional regulator